MMGFKEVSEMGNLYQKEISNKTKAFEAASEAKDVKEVVELQTRNKALEGKRHPETNVLFVRKTINVDGTKMEGVFPRFDSITDVYLPKDMRLESDTKQFVYCTKVLAKRIEANPSLAGKFSARQLEMIKNGDQPSNLLWHHSEVPGKMQLVNHNIHEKTGHTGGRAIWGGGSECRKKGSESI